MKKQPTLFLIGAFSLGIAGTTYAQGDPPPTPVQPDIVLLADRASEPVGDGIYGTADEQSIVKRTIGTRPATFGIGVQNDDPEVDSRIRFRGSRGDRQFQVKYSMGDRNVTAQVVRGFPLAIEANSAVRLQATAKATRLTLGKRARKAIRLTAVSGDLSDSAGALVLKKPAKRR